uniref:Ribosomal protein S7 n=1 Tax=Lithodesmium undulatum TaxID=59812 RepID=A0A7T6UZP9_LITUN|nr:ribosomal protein S7 [Lithodesmium undulatum]QQJ94649.1 ribosomal protein S7 [Lithodesmium undulatum]
MNSFLYKFKTKLTCKGKKSKSFIFFNKSLKFLQKNIKKNHKKLIQISIINLAPVFNIKSVKKNKKKSKEFPFFLTNKLRVDLSVKFLIDKIKLRKTSNSKNQLSNEFVKIFKKESSILLKKKNLDSQSFAQKKYANYRWF